ncbi:MULTISPECIES: sugar ABC transporter substrate-binding protein [Cysteiniphilum]|uniref:D-ribose ABC transporter substrate-binding protein n=1 Tax=Cysteiniphilum litorale TaxID=2056700 RepID=A0A8J3E9E9_9GAMM|nr:MULTISPECIES: sugar ABC transporter substrate-binding protein [Cysteiniphilum]GGF99056.1 D-ribose ABC transporter substrate-binding protein [Cysteiniphilum litorale]
MYRQARVIMAFIFLIVIFITIGIVAWTRLANKNDVGVVMSNLSNPYFGYITKSINSTLTAHGYTATVLDASDSLNRSIRDIDNLVSRGYKLIIFNPVDSNESANVIKRAQAKGVRFITVDRSVKGVKVLSHIESNNFQGGQLAAKYILNKLGDKSKILELQGFKDSSTTQERTKGFADGLMGSNAKIVAAYVANYDKNKAEHYAYQFLKRDNEVNAVFAENDLMALGAADAAKRLGKKLVIVGYDGIPEAKEAIKNGILDATIEQQPLQLGEMAAKVAMNVLQGAKETLHSQHKIDVELLSLSQGGKL